MKQFANNMCETEKVQLQKTSQCQNLLVPHLVPTLEELLKLHQKPLPGVTDLDVKLNNEAFIYFMEFVLPKIAGAKGWQEEMCLNPLSNMKINTSDEAFALYFAAKTCGISGMQITALLQAIMAKQNKPAVGPTGNMMADQNKACNGSMGSSGRPSSIKARNGHQPLRVQSWISSGKSTIQMQVSMIKGKGNPE